MNENWEGGNGNPGEGYELEFLTVDCVLRGLSEGGKRGRAGRGSDRRI